MSQNVITRRLRPYLFTSFKKIQFRSYQSRALSSTTLRYSKVPSERDVTNDYERRVFQLEASSPPSEWYPRLPLSAHKPTSVKGFRSKYEGLKSGETCEDGIVVLMGTSRVCITKIIRLSFWSCRPSPVHTHRRIQACLLRHQTRRPYRPSHSPTQ